MVVYPIANKANQVEAFELDMVFIGKRKIIELLIESKCDEIEAHWAGRKSEELIRFLYKRTQCVVLEPYGDNSRFWIGPIQGIGSGTDLSDVMQQFSSYKVSVFRKIVGHIVSLGFVPYLLQKSFKFHR